MSTGMIRTITALTALIAFPACGPNETAPDEEPTATATATATASPEATDSPTPGRSPTDGADTAGWTECTNEQVGFTISYPPDWTTASIGPETECRWFDPENFTVAAGQEAPLVALSANPEQAQSYEQAIDFLQNPDGDRVTVFEQTSIDGTEAARFERVQEEDLLYPPGTRYYGYVLNHDGNAFYVETTSVPGTETEANYDRNKDVVDRAVRTVRFQ